MKHISNLANCLRFLAVDAIDAAQSGHPGMPLGMADVMAVLFLEKLKYEPTVPKWADRDRVVLSNGHGSMLLYAALYLSGYNHWSLDDIKQFRQYGSASAGHPEYDVDRGVEVTTGPLGQGIAMALGLAVGMKRRVLLERQRPAKVYCFVGDGCLMEGISHEACSLAPHLIDAGLILLWDDNGISIDGGVQDWMEYDVCQRFKSYGFLVIEAVDAHDFDAISQALDLAADAKQPVLIQFKSTIGKGCKRIEGLAEAHGQPLKKADIEQMRLDLNWPYQPFEIPEEYLKAWDRQHRYPNAVAEDEPAAISVDISGLDAVTSMSTRQASQRFIQHCLHDEEGVMGGSADLAASTLTNFSDEKYLSHVAPESRNIAYGVREFAMFSIANGIAATGVVPFVSTFLAFLDYGKNALRLAALMGLRVVYVLTHDSIFLGEDGPTHQPVEQLTTCRAMPNVELWRPCGLRETAVAWQESLKNGGPTVLALSRQAMPAIPICSDDGIRRGYYHVRQAEGPIWTIIATGSEVPVALELADRLLQEEIECDVVSVPCWDRMMQNDFEAFLRTAKSKRFVIEAGHPMPWLGLVECAEQIVGVDDYGCSAKPKDIAKHFGMDIDSLYVKIKSVLPI